MRLKPVLASIILLGISGSAFAATNSNVSMQDQMNSMQSQMNQMEMMINQNNGATQTMGGTALQSRIAACPNWYDSISVSGLVNVNAIGTDNRDFIDQNNASDLELSNADLFVDAQVNNWTKAHIGLNYQTVNNNYPDGLYTAAQATNGTAPFNIGSPKRFNDGSLITKPLASDLVDEAYVTFGNFCENPFFLRVGKQYVNFGNYDRFATVPSFTQLLTQTNETAATLGFLWDGFYGSAYTFRGISSRTDARNGLININNWGANLGWSLQGQDAKLNLQASYLNNMVDVDYISETIASGPINPVAANQQFGMLSLLGYQKTVGGVSVDASGSISMFDAYAHFVTATGNFDQLDVAAAPPSAAHGAEPSALNVGAGLTFNIMDHKSRVGVGYEYSWDAVTVGPFGMPQQRVEGTFDVNVSKNVVAGLDVYNDQDYNVSDGGTGNERTVGVLHLGVMFA